MSRSLLRFGLAVGLAALLGGVAGVPLSAQYGPMPYQGAFFWLDANRANQGYRWFPAPRRGWVGAGDGWSAATSFPPRIWEYQVGGAPPNDACWVVPFAVGGSYADRGPFGLQVNQYLAEWWEGTTYLSNPGRPAGWNAQKFGWFDFANTRTDRLLVGPDGLPQGFPGDVDNGDAGACVGNLLARQRGAGLPWEASQRDDPGTGEPCMAIPQVYRVRMNLEIRCEPDLSLRDDYTTRFYPIFDAWPFPALPDGAIVPVIFPPDYPAGDSGALGRVWVRRVDTGLERWVNAGNGPYAANFPAGSVFQGAGGSPWGAVAANRPEYLQHHQWRLDASITSAARRASDRNMLKSYDHDGNVISDSIVIRDLMTGVDDCLSLNIASYEQPGDITWPCGRVNSPGVARTTLQTPGRTVDVGASDPNEVAAAVVAATFPGAVGNRQPAPAGGNFWFEMDTFALRCQAGAYQQRDLRSQAAAAVAAQDALFNQEWARYLDLRQRAFFDPTLNFARDAAYNAASTALGAREGWAAILAYRNQVHPEMHAAFAGAGYLQAGGSAQLPVFFDGASAACDALWVPLQPFGALVGNYDVAPPNAAGLTADMRLRSFTEVPNSERFTDQQQAAGLPHYLSSSAVPLTVGPASHYVRDSLRAGVDFPVGPTHWNADDVDVSPSVHIPFACGGAPRRDLFLPDVVNVPTYGYRDSAGAWQQILNPADPRRQGLDASGRRAFDPRTLASYTECSDPAFGGGDCYASAELEQRVEAYAPGGASTLTGRALADHRAALSAGHVNGRGTYRAERLRGYDPTDRLAATRTFDTYKRESGGDLDASGQLIQLDASGMPTGTGDPTSYAVTATVSDYQFDYQFDVFGGVSTGFADLDYLSNATRHQFLFVTDYWGVAPGTASHAPPSVIQQADMETMTRTGPVRLSAAMGYARGAGLGSCTVCSENGCAPGVVEEFPDERFTSSVTQGTLVCLIGPVPLPRPAYSCPTVSNTR